RLLLGGTDRTQAHDTDGNKPGRALSRRGKIADRFHSQVFDVALQNRVNLAATASCRSFSSAAVARGGMAGWERPAEEVRRRARVLAEVVLANVDKSLVVVEDAQEQEVAAVAGS